MKAASGLGLLLPVERLSRKGLLAGSALAILYAGALALQLVEHAMWLDETQAWLIARASASPLELRQHLRFEGHPPLWHLALWPVARSSPNPELMKLLTFIVGSLFGAVVALGRAVPPALRPVLLAGFLPLFGYGVLSRPYLLGLLFAFAYLEVLHRGRSGPLRLLAVRLLLILLLSLTHLLYTVVAGALLLGEIADLRGRSARLKERSILIATATLVMLLSTVAFLPDPSAAPIPRAVEVDRIGVRAVLLSLIEAGGGGIWLGAFARLAVFAELAALIALISLSILISPRRAGPLALGVGALLMNRLVGYGGEWWHVGVTSFALVVVALLALWHDPLQENRKLLAHSLRPAVALLTLLLLMGQVAAAWSWFSDESARLPYSSAREAAAIVMNWCGSECPVVVDRAATGAPVSAYLGAVPVFRLDDLREGTYAIWDADSGTGEVSWDALLSAMQERGKRSVGVVSSLRQPPDGFVVVGQTGPAIWHKEEYLIVALDFTG